MYKEALDHWWDYIYKYLKAPKMHYLKHWTQNKVMHSQKTVASK